MESIHKSSVGTDHGGILYFSTNLSQTLKITFRSCIDKTLKIMSPEFISSQQCFTTRLLPCFTKIYHKSGRVRAHGTNPTFSQFQANFF